MENLISEDVAKKDWCNFLKEHDAKALLPDEDLKHGSKEDKAEYKAQVANLEKITSAIQKGLVIIDGARITQKLKYPIMDSEKNLVHGGKLEFSHRWTASDRLKIYENLDPTQTKDAMIAQQRLCAFVTGWERELLGKLDSYDLKITDQIISVFFM